MIDVEAIRELCEAATEGPWEIWTSNSVRRISARGDGDVLSAYTARYDGMPDLCGRNLDNDLRFIAAARTLVPQILAAYEQACAERNELASQLVGAEAANAETTETLVEHSELNGHIEVAEQCRDYLAHEIADNGDPGGGLQDFVDSLRIVIDQLDRQRRSRNWYEVAYQAGKQKLIEYAVAKETTSLRALLAETVGIAKRLATRDPMDLTCVVCGENMMAHPAQCRVLDRLSEIATAAGLAKGDGNE